VNARVRYPMAARLAGEIGYPVLRFTVTANGRLRELKIARSSGYPSLDEAGLAAVRRTPLAPPPASRDMEVEVELFFDVKS
jgi:TonB family protein